MLTSKSTFQPTVLHIGGKAFIIPDWEEVPLGTQMGDIVWEKKPLEKSKTTLKFKSSTSSAMYTLYKLGSKYQCNCPGFWRSQTRECKHVKKAKSQGF